MNQIVQALTQALEHALDAHADDRGLPVARDVAHVLGLEGLDRALGVCQPGTEKTQALERRLRELLAACRDQGDIRVFMEADAGLARLAADHGAIVHGEPGSLEGTLALLDALEDYPLADDASRAVAQRTRLNAPVAAAVRATLDWLSGDERRLPVRLRAEDSAIEFVLPRVSPVGIRAADAVLSSVGGSLGPTLSGARGTGRGWMVRVPMAAARETYLMIIQGGLKLAVPWHAVLRLCMTARVEFDANVHALTAPVLEPLVPLASSTGDHPVVLVACGLRRAYVVADQLIWKLPADPVLSFPDPRAPAYSNFVRTEDGEIFCVADPAILLASVEPLPVPDLDTRGSEATPEPEVAPAPVVAEAEPTPIDSFRTTTSPPATAAPMPEAEPAETIVPPSAVAMPEAVPAETIVPLDAPWEIESAAPQPRIPMLDPSRATPLPLRAPDDSISARLFLARRLEPTGFEVRSVATASELMRELDGGAWTIAFVDVGLPDARGREFLDNVRARARARGAEVVALVRDGDKVRISGEAGLAHSLTKPFERDLLQMLMNQLGFGTERT